MPDENFDMTKDRGGVCCQVWWFFVRFEGCQSQTAAEGDWWLIRRAGAFPPGLILVYLTDMASLIITHDTDICHTSNHLLLLTQNRQNTTWWIVAMQPSMSYISVCTLLIGCWYTTHMIFVHYSYAVSVLLICCLYTTRVLLICCLYTSILLVRFVYTTQCQGRRQ